MKLSSPLLLPVAASVALGASLALSHSQNAPSASAASPPPTRAEGADEIAALRAAVDRLKGLVPDQAHAMKDVGYHYANLWFAAQAGNWPLAEFYWGETRSHLRWAVRIIPVRKNLKGEEVRLQEILDPIEQTTLEGVHQAIAAKDQRQFREAYTRMLDSCYACHVASDKPYLRLQIPEQPEAPIIRFAPAP